MNIQTKNAIKESLKQSIRNFFQNKKLKTSHVLDHVFPIERRIRSLIGGLETSMGTTVWEPIAKTLATSNDFEVKKLPLLKPQPFPQEIQNKITELKEQRESKNNKISLPDCGEQLKKVALSLNRDSLTFVKPPAGKGVDLYFIKAGTEYVFDLKTNQPNQRAGLDLNLQLLEWYAYRYCDDPTVDFKPRIAFPFNPYNQKSWWQVQGARVFPLTENEAWVEDKFWDFCSGEKNTWQQILQIFIELGQENFGQEFHDIFYDP